MIFFILLMFLCPQLLFSQRTDYDFREFKIGIFFGINIGDYVTHINTRMPKLLDDSLKSVGVNEGGGINLGGIFTWKMVKQIDARFVPTFSIQKRGIHYQFGNIAPEQDTTIEIEPYYFELSTEFKYKSDLIGAGLDRRIYVVFGYKYGRNIGTNEGSKPKGLKIVKDDFTQILGLGIDMYFDRFKLALELKYSHGFPNLLIVDQKSPYSLALEALKSRLWSINLLFE